MAIVTINDTHLYNIANSIREKAGTSEKLAVEYMSAAIDAIHIGSGGTGEAFEVTGDCYNIFRDTIGVFPKYGDYINWDCNNITDARQMFCKASDMERVPFKLHFNNQYVKCENMFMGCNELKEAPYFVNEVKSDDCEDMFRGCYKLKEISAESVKFNFDTGRAFNRIFYDCYSLRSFPIEWFEPASKGSVNDCRVQYLNAFTNCMALDEIVDLHSPVITNGNVYGSDYFANMFNNCYRLSRLKFKNSVNHRINGSTIDLSYNVGWASAYTPSYTNMLDDGTGNSGITEADRVVDDATYQALKNTPNWFTTNYNYSRYNKVSAIETINSLPDTSYYVKAYYGGKNYIKFREDAGSKTDGGRIGDMTEEQIAVSTAKGWTVAFT